MPTFGVTVPIKRECVICVGTSIPSTLDFSKKTEHVPIKALAGKSFSLPSPLSSLYHFIIMSMMLAAWELLSGLPEFPRHWSSLDLPWSWPYYCLESFVCVYLSLFISVFFFLNDSTAERS